MFRSTSCLQTFKGPEWIVRFRAAVSARWRCKSLPAVDLRVGCLMMIVRGRSFPQFQLSVLQSIRNLKNKRFRLTTLWKFKWNTNSHHLGIVFIIRRRMKCAWKKYYSAKVTEINKRAFWILIRRTMRGYPDLQHTRKNLSGQICFQRIGVSLGSHRGMLSRKKSLMYAKRKREHRQDLLIIIRINGKSSMVRREHKVVQRRVSRGLILPRIMWSHSKTCHPPTSMANQILNWPGSRTLILVFLRRTSQDLKQRNRRHHQVRRVMIRISRLIRIS